MAILNYSIQTAVYNFNCPLCPVIVRKGDAYLQDPDGNSFCFCQLPARRLRPLTQKVNEQLIDSNKIY